MRSSRYRQPYFCHITLLILVSDCSACFTQAIPSIPSATDALVLAAQQSPPLVTHRLCQQATMTRPTCAFGGNQSIPVWLRASMHQNLSSRKDKQAAAHLAQQFPKETAVVDTDYYGQTVAVYRANTSVNL